MEEFDFLLNMIRFRIKLDGIDFNTKDTERDGK
jgi:hypothetical protein